MEKTKILYLRQSQIYKNSLSTAGKYYLKGKKIPLERIENTMNDFRQLEFINGKPKKNLTDVEWQNYFNLHIAICDKYPAKQKRFGCKNVVDGKDGIVTNYHRYVSFINDVLSVIRKNECPHEYCFFEYQIRDLAKFDFGERKLQTKYLPHYECWEVWLA